MTSHNRLHLLEKLQYTFKNPHLLEQALTHRSFGSDHYERLEFLGDAVLNLTISELLYHEFSTLPEGDLSRIRANLVKQETLVEIAIKLDLAHHLRLGDGEKKSGGQKRPSILADTVESIFGAIYLDAGFEAVKTVIFFLFKKFKLSSDTRVTEKDPKTSLQEWLQSRHYELPAYSVAGITGQTHKQFFDVECTIEKLALSERGIGTSRKSAEQEAAKAMLETIRKKAIA